MIKFYQNLAKAGFRKSRAQKQDLENPARKSRI